MATVRAPCALAVVIASIVSRVVPLCETPIATSLLPSRAALVSAMCGSLHEKATQPMRCSFICRSAPTTALAPEP